MNDIKYHKRSLMYFVVVTIRSVAFSLFVFVLSVSAIFVDVLLGTDSTALLSQAVLYNTVAAALIPYFIWYCLAI